MNAPLAAPDLAAQYYERGVERMRGYRGIPMICVDGLHEQIAALAVAALRPGARVLDVGCGRGAFALRMADAGFSVDACDLRDLCMCKDRVRFVHGSAEALEPDARYDAIFLLEVIEHVEAPFELLRKYAALLAPGGRLFVSTPNVDSDLSRAWFFLTGRHWYFEPHNVVGDGHITPIHDFQVKAFIDSAQLHLAQQVAGPEDRAVRPGLLRLLLALVVWRRRLRGSPPNRGASTIYILAHGKEDRARPARVADPATPSGAA